MVGKAAKLGSEGLKPKWELSLTPLLWRQRVKAQRKRVYFFWVDERFPFLMEIDGREGTVRNTKMVLRRAMDEGS